MAMAAISRLVAMGRRMKTSERFMDETVRPQSNADRRAVSMCNPGHLMRALCGYGKRVNLPHRRRVATGQSRAYADYSRRLQRRSRCPGGHQILGSPAEDR